MATNTATLNVHGDILEVRWTGSVWVAPCCGAQYGRCRDAMRVELTRYLESCGEDVDEMEDEIEAMLENIEQ